MSSLYELTNEYAMLLEMAEDPDVDPEVFSDTLEGLGGEIEIKADGYAKVMKSLESQIAGIKAEEARLGARRKTLEGNIDRMKRSLQQAMEITGKTKFKTELFSFGIQMNGGLAPLIIDRKDYENFPEEFRKVKYEPDNKKIREYLETNTLDWARIGERGKSLRIS